jgi:hypothetical protein
VAENGDPVAAETYTQRVLTGVSYPSGSGNAGNGTSGAFTYGPTGAQAGQSWQFAAGQNPVTDANVLSQWGKIVQYTLTDGATPYTATYSYDADGAWSPPGARGPDGPRSTDTL